jgi:predicted DNA-binding protein (UPF0251 family)/predicted Fe-Mo cluster-binding NifX family protein
MSRPPKQRCVSPAPFIDEFRPVGVPDHNLRQLVLPLDGLEALRLIDLVGLEQIEAAQQMGVSRQTFGRILASARRVVSQAVVGGLALKIKAVGNLEIKRSTERANAQIDVRVAVSAHAPSLDAAVAPRFARAPGFLLVDISTLQFKYIANSVAATQMQELGPGAAALIADAGASVLLTGFVGAKAARSLAEAGISVADGLGALTVREAVARFASGEITPVLPETITNRRAEAR